MAPTVHSVRDTATPQRGLMLLEEDSFKQRTLTLGELQAVVNGRRTIQMLPPLVGRGDNKLSLSRLQQSSMRTTLPVRRWRGWSGT